eukprot:gene3774-4722_t
MSYQQVGTSDSYENWSAPNIEETKQVKPIEVRATIEAWYPPVKDPPIILKDVDVTFEPGTMTALMGASGAGKTSLLNVLSGKALGTLVGEILLNNAPVNYGNIKNVCNFVPQDDLMYDSLTVSEALMYYAQLRVLKDSFDMPATESYRQELVSNYIIRLGLDYVKDVKIGNVLNPGISGGQRKRVSVGMELMNNPSLLFLDEPTSGLDSAIQEELMDFINELLLKNMTIVCTIHAPSANVFMKFGNLLLLARNQGLGNGSVAFYGSTSESIQYFNDLGKPMPEFVNPAEHILDCTNAEYTPMSLPGFWKFRRLWVFYRSLPIVFHNPTANHRIETEVLQLTGYLLMVTMTSDIPRLRTFAERVLRSDRTFKAEKQPADDTIPYFVITRFLILLISEMMPDDEIDGLCSERFFYSVDTDRDGELSVDELAEVFGQLFLFDFIRFMPHVGQERFKQVVVKPMHALLLAAAPGDQVTYRHYKNFMEMRIALREHVKESAGTSSKNLVDGYANAEDLQRMTAEPTTLDFMAQLDVLTRRAFYAWSRDQQMVKSVITLAIGLPFIISILYINTEVSQKKFQDVVSLCFLTLVTSMSTPLSSRETDPLAHEPVIEVTSEGLVRRRSSRVFNPSLSAIVLSFMLYFFVELHAGDAEFEGWVSLFGALVSIVIYACMTGLSLGIITDNLANATAWVVPILLCNVMFSGFIVTADSIPVYFVWIYYLSAFHYCFSCMMVTMFAGADLGCDSDASSTDCPFGPDGTGDDVLEFYEIEFDTYRPNMLLVWFFIGVTIVNGYALLYSRLKINLVVKNTEDAEGKTDLGFFENITRDYAIASYIFRQEDIMEFIASLALTGITIICTIHAPSASVYMKFTNLLLLARNQGVGHGSVAFYGSTSESIQYFNDLGKPLPEFVNPAEHILDCTNAEYTPMSLPSFWKFRRLWVFYRSLPIVFHNPTGDHQMQVLQLTGYLLMVTMTSDIPPLRTFAERVLSSDRTFKSFLEIFADFSGCIDLANLGEFNLQYLLQRETAAPDSFALTPPKPPHRTTSSSVSFQTPPSEAETPVGLKPGGTPQIQKAPSAAGEDYATSAGCKVGDAVRRLQGGGAALGSAARLYVRANPDVDVTFEPGTMTALMGASGAGKTSLLNVLSGKALGTLNDLMYDVLTVTELLTYHAQLRIVNGPNGLPATDQYHDELVARLIARLGLTYVKDVQIGDCLNPGISGGQRKRVSVGMELMDNPSLLFLDEPTTGLDSAVQDSAQSQHAMFSLTRVEALDVFKVMGFDKVFGTSSKNLVDGYANAEDLQRMTAEPMTLGFLAQLDILCRRGFYAWSRDSQMVKSVITLAIALPFIISILYINAEISQEKFQDVASLCFISLITSMSSPLS